MILGLSSADVRMTVGLSSLDGRQLHDTGPRSWFTTSVIGDEGELLLRIQTREFLKVRVVSGSHPDWMQEDENELPFSCLAMF